MSCICRRPALPAPKVAGPCRAVRTYRFCGAEGRPCAGVRWYGGKTSACRLPMHVTLYTSPSFAADSPETRLAALLTVALRCPTTATATPVHHLRPARCVPSPVSAPPPCPPVPLRLCPVPCRLYAPVPPPPVAWLNSGGSAHRRERHKTTGRVTYRGERFRVNTFSAVHRSAPRRAEPSRAEPTGPARLARPGCNRSRNRRGAARSTGQHVGQSACHSSAWLGAARRGTAPTGVRGVCVCR